MPRPLFRHHRLGRSLVLLTLLVVVLGTWTIKTLHSDRLATVKDRLRIPVAERLAGTPWQNSRWARRLLDRFAQIDVYRNPDLQLPREPQDRVVLYGDSITEFWQHKAPDTLPRNENFINRGISGQTTPALLWRFQQDVLDLHPGNVVLLGGTNDFLHPKLHISAAETENNLRRMATLARQQGVHVFLCSLLPVRQRSRRDADRIVAVNAWLRDYANENHIPYVDYFSAMADTRGELPIALSDDGVHPNYAGYKVMAETLIKALHTDPSKAKL